MSESEKHSEIQPPFYEILGLFFLPAMELFPTLELLLLLLTSISLTNSACWAARTVRL